MSKYRKNTKHPVIVTGIHAHLDKWTIDKRTRLARQLRESKEGIAAIFPNGPDHACWMLIDRIVYKALKLSIFEQMDYKRMVGGKTKTEAAKGDDESPISEWAERAYVTVANSLREDIRLLNKLAQAQNPLHEEDDLQEYLRFKKAERINVEPVGKPEQPRTVSKEGSCLF